MQRMAIEVHICALIKAYHTPSIWSVAVLLSSHIQRICMCVCDRVFSIVCLLSAIIIATCAGYNVTVESISSHRVRM